MQSLNVTGKRAEPLWEPNNKSENVTQGLRFLAVRALTTNRGR